MAEYHAVVETRELGPGQIREAEVEGRTLAVANVGQTYYAVDAVCPHDGTNLARDGQLRGSRLRCPNDGWTFDIETGRAIEPPGGEPLHRYDIRVEGNLVYVGPALPSP